MDFNLVTPKADGIRFGYTVDFSIIYAYNGYSYTVSDDSRGFLLIHNNVLNKCMNNVIV